MTIIQGERDECIEKQLKDERQHKKLETQISQEKQQLSGKLSESSRRIKKLEGDLEDSTVLFYFLFYFLIVFFLKQNPIKKTEIELKLNRQKKLNSYKRFQSLKMIIKKERL